MENVSTLFSGILCLYSSRWAPFTATCGRRHAFLTAQVHRCLRPWQHGFTDLEGVFVHQDDGLEGGAAFVGQLVERFLFAPALPLQGVTYHTGRAFEARAEAEGDVRAGLGAAAARQVDLEPAGRVHAAAGLPVVVQC